MRLRPLLGALAALIVAACATAERHAPSPSAPPAAPPPVAAEPAQPRPEPPPRVLPLSALRGWGAEDHVEAYLAFAETCGVSRDPAILPICRTARALGRLDAAQARAFLETNFRAEALPGEGVLTAYFAPEYAARGRRDAEFSAPVRPKPSDLATLNADRATIESTPLDGPPLAWMRPEELFFLQIQGSGVLTFEDGRRMKVLYAANNGRPFVGVANAMRDRGLLARDNTSGEAIRAWLAAHRGAEANEIMRLNPRYAFFSLTPDDGRQPVGAAGVPLPTGRAVALDLSLHPLGEPLWIDAEAPLLVGAFPAYRRFVMGLDTGGAIKGAVRADLYLGQGAAAGTEAGRVRHTLKLYRLVAAGSAGQP